MLRSEDAVRLFRAHPQDLLGAPLPAPRSGEHDVLDGLATKGGRTVLDVAPPPVRLRRAAPSGYDAGTEPFGDSGQQLAQLHDQVETPPVTDYGHRLLRGSQIGAVAALVTIAAAAVVSARYDSGLHVHQFALAMWGIGAALCAVAAATLGSDPRLAATDPTTRRVVGAALVAVLLTCTAGVEASAAGLAGPSWVLFFPVVIVCGAVLGPALGLLVGAGAAAGIYAAAGVSHTLGLAGIGHLVVILPAAPAAGWAAGALAQLARQEAADAAARRAALERDVRKLAEVLDEVARGDLTRVPAPGDAADPVATSLAVVFADTLLALRRLVRQMDSVTAQVASSARQLSATAEQSVGSVEMQTSAVAETTSTVEQLAATAGSIADIAVQVARFAGSTRLDVESGAEAVRASGAAMEQIAVRVDELAVRARSLRERISEVGVATKLIDDIARRTTILAVNASIEAARAGDRGSGFATVAAEVDTLAARARDATAQIGEILAELERHAADTAVASSEGMAAVDYGAGLQVEVVDALGRIAGMVDYTTAAASEITEATRQQRYASDAVVAAMSTVTRTSSRYREGSHGHAAAARRMHDLAEALKSTLSGFRVS